MEAQRPQPKRPTADALNAHLRGGGVVQVTTYGRSTIYSERHAGWFYERDGNLMVRAGGRGKRGLQLSIKHLMLVSLRGGR
jgi:hypothetical protein